MREIKFRAWDYNDEKVIPWESIRIEKDENETNLSVVVFDGSVGDHYDDFPIMQYTGLKDSKGVEIYEGDILRCYHWTNGFVFYLDGSYHVSSDQVSLDYENHTTYDHLNSDLIADNTLIVIGNIYDNPELLND